MRKICVFVFIVLFTNVVWTQEYLIKKEERFLNKMLKQPVSRNLEWNIAHLPSDFSLLDTKEKTISSLESILKNDRIKELLDLNFKKEKLKILNVGDAIEFKGSSIRFANIAISFTVTDKEYLLNFEELKKHIIGLGGYVSQEKNKLHITSFFEHLIIYNKESKRWVHFKLDTISLLHIFERTLIKDIIETYYNRYFEESSQKWDQESISIFKEVLKEDWGSGPYKNLDFDTFCNCKIKNYEKISEDVYYSDAFQESKGKEISARCQLISELL